jgi:hypothetical protein
MVHGVACGTINNWRIGNIFAIMDQYSPNVDEDEEKHVCELLQREDKREHVIWDRLREPVYWVKCMRRVWCWHNPFVMWLVQTLVERWMMQAAMDPVDEVICEEDEKWKLGKIIPHARSVLSCVIYLAVSTYFRQEQRGSEERHEWE